MINRFGNGSTESYLADYMPGGRRAAIARTGMSGIGKEVAGIKQAIASEQNNYARMALNSQLDNAMRRWQQEWQNQMPAYRNLARQGFRDNAQRTFAAESAAGRPTSLAAMAANSILGGNHYGYGIIDLGRLVAPAGNALEDALAAGIDPNSSLAQMLADQDVFSQEDYMPGSRPSLATGYRSMGLGGGSYTGNTDPFAYGGSGAQAAVEAQQVQQKELNDAYRQHNDAWKQITNRNPFGRYGEGSQLDGRGTVKQYGDPRADYSGERLAQGPALPVSVRSREKGGDPSSLGVDPNGWISEGRGDSFGYDEVQGRWRKLRDPLGVHVPTAAETQADIQKAMGDWQKFYGDQGYAYTPKRGDGSGYNTEINKNHPDRAPRMMDMKAPNPNDLNAAGNTFSAYPAAMGIADVKPNIQKSAKPFGGSLSPEWTSNDQFTAPLFSSRGGGVQNNYAVPSSASASSFDRYAMGPMEVGALYASAPFASSPAPRSIQPFSRLNR